jgi:two-component system, OmpR family, response regulator
MLRIGLNGVRVLVVEDDVDCRELFKIILELDGATVATAGTAWQALRMVGTFSPDVIVSNLALPDEDGCWLMRSTRAGVRAGARLPATVIVSTNNEDSVRTRCVLAGCAAFLTKPVDAADLCGIVARLAPNTTSPPRPLCGT